MVRGTLPLGARQFFSTTAIRLRVLHFITFHCSRSVLSVYPSIHPSINQSPMDMWAGIYNMHLAQQKSGVAYVVEE